MTFSIDVSQWAWPQWTYAVLIGVNILSAAILDGTPKKYSDGKHSAGVTLIASAIAVFILISGGFFG